MGHKTIQDFTAVKKCRHNVLFSVLTTMINFIPDAPMGPIFPVGPDGPRDPFGPGKPDWPVDPGLPTGP